jgi:hypothetical protein
MQSFLFLRVSSNRVGKIYEEIIRLFTEGPMIRGPIVPDVTDLNFFVATADIQADNLKLQVTPGAWGLGYKEILIESAYDRKSALAALTKVSVQGEGPLAVSDEEPRVSGRLRLAARPARRH